MQQWKVRSLWIIDARSDLLAEVFAKDFQVGTAGAKGKKVPARHLTNTSLVEMDRVIRELDPRVGR